MTTGNVSQSVEYGARGKDFKTDFVMLLAGVHRIGHWCSVQHLSFRALPTPSLRDL